MSTTEPRLRDPDTLVEEIERRRSEIERLNAELAAWEATSEGTPKRLPSFTSVSGNEVDALYTPAHLSGSYVDKLGVPGGFPTPGGRTRPCTGPGSGPCASSPVRDREEPNRRYKYLLAKPDRPVCRVRPFPR